MINKNSGFLFAFFRDVNSACCQVIHENHVIYGDGVEDTRLEAKAKNTKKSEAKPRTALPRTDPLDAKAGMLEAKDTGASVLQKKRSSKFFFKRSSKEENKNGLRKFFARFLAFSYITLKMNKSLLL